MPKRGSNLPKRVYKYRHFSDQSLECLIEDKLFFADPSTFNDPLDTKPSLDVDLAAADLEDMLRTLVERRVTGEMSAAARTIRYRGPRTLEHIAKQGRRRADEVIADLRYHATNPDYEMDDPLRHLLGHSVEAELLRRYERGVVSLAERPDCPLMWSHYGDQHKGVCFGYSAPADVQLEKVRYGGARSVRASHVAAMLNGDAAAAKRVDAAVLLKKARDWQYEKEWRLIGERGLQDSLLELEEVVFGLRCPATVAFIVATALAKRERAVKLYEIRQHRGTFLLRKAPLDIDELMVSWPRRARSVYEAFDDVTVPDEPS